MRSRLIPLHLPKSEYDELVRRAIQDERDPLQQARYLLRRALKNVPEADLAAPTCAMVNHVESGHPNE